MYRVVLLMTLFVLVACGSPAVSTTPDQIASAFADADLEVANPRPMTRDNFGMAPMKTDQAVIFDLPTHDAGGRIFVFDNAADRDELKRYYDELGKASAMFFSHTFTKGDTILLQLGGNVPDGVAAQFSAVLDNLP